jgi:hypothetical protein
MSNLSPMPGTPQTAYKAIAATSLAMVAAFIAFWIGDDDPFTKKDAGEAFLAALAAGGLTGIPTYAVKNRAKTV